jgi:cell cycle checkpoint protein
MDGNDRAVPPPSQKRQRRRRRPGTLPYRLNWPTSQNTETNTNGSKSEASTTLKPVASTVTLQSTKSSKWAFDDNDVVSLTPTASNARLKSSKGQTMSQRSSTLTNKSGYAQNNRPSEKTNELWVDKYHPMTSKALCVAPKKVKEVKSWFDEHEMVWSNGDGHTSLMPQTPAKMLVLIGGPGIGKSTMIQVLAKEQNWDILEWNDETSDVGDITGIGYETPLSSFQDFLSSVGCGYSSLDIENSIGEAKAVERANTISFVGMNQGKIPSRSNIEVEGHTQTKKAIVLLDDIPNLHTRESEEKFRGILSRYLSRSQVPTILIFSNVCEGKHKPQDLERLIDPLILGNPDLTKVIQIHPVTLAKMRNSLQNVIRREGIPSLNVPSGLYEELHCMSGGDLRHALMTLQFQVAKKLLDAKSKKANVSQRDMKLSTFHALGKLLYAKRKTHLQVTPYSGKQWNNDDHRPPLQFDPEQVVEESDIGLNNALLFLGYHCPNFFTDITELSKAFDGFSDADLFVKKSYQANTSMLTNYAVSLSGRAVANANRSPAPTKFRQFCAPKVYEVMRKSRERYGRMSNFSHRVSQQSGSLGIASHSSMHSSFATDYLPFLNILLPQGLLISIFCICIKF